MTRCQPTRRKGHCCSRASVGLRNVGKSQIGVLGCMKRARKGRQCPLCGRSIPPDSRPQRQCNSASRREGGQGHGRPDDRHGRDKPRRRVAQISPGRPVTEGGPVDVVLTRTSSESDGSDRPGPCWDGKAESADRAAELGERRLVLHSDGLPEPCVTECCPRRALPCARGVVGCAFSEPQPDAA